MSYVSSPRTQRSGTYSLELHSYRCAPTHGVGCPQQQCTTCPQTGRTISRSEHEELIEALRTRMQTAAAKALYKLRRQTVELVNADWKQHRQLRRFSARGLKRVRCQIGLLVLAHNLVTLVSEEKKTAEQSVGADTITPVAVVTKKDGRALYGASFTRPAVHGGSSPPRHNDRSIHVPSMLSSAAVGSALFCGGMTVFIGVLVSSRSIIVPFAWCSFRRSM